MQKETRLACPAYAESAPGTRPLKMQTHDLQRDEYTVQSDDEPRCMRPFIYGYGNLPCVFLYIPLTHRLTSRKTFLRLFCFLVMAHRPRKYFAIFVALFAQCREDNPVWQNLPSPTFLCVLFEEGKARRMDYKGAIENILKKRNGRPVRGETLKNALAQLFHEGDVKKVDQDKLQKALRNYKIKVSGAKRKVDDAALKVVDKGVASVIGGRDYQEDRYQIVSTKDLFAVGVYDGHSGSSISTRLASKGKKGLLGYLLQKPECLPPKPSQSACTKAFLEYDSSCLPTGKQEDEEEGSTAVIAIQKHKTIALYNVGDSRACIFGRQSGEVLMETKDHKIEDTSEMRRLLKSGAPLEWDDSDCMLRVDAHLAMSRAFGDHCLGAKRVIAKPDVYLFVPSACGSDSSYLLVIGSDGIWDEWKAEAVGELIKKKGGKKTCQELADLLVEKVDEDEGDNATVVVVEFSF